MVYKSISTFYFLNQSWKVDSLKVCIFRTPILQTNRGWELNIYIRCSRSITEYTVNSEPNTSLRPQVHAVLSLLCNLPPFTSDLYLQMTDILGHPFSPVCSPSLNLPTNFSLLEIQKDAEDNPKMSETESNIFPTDFHLKCPFVFFQWFQRSGPECRFYNLDVIFGSSFSLVPPA